jgi:hypothetical protein
VVRYLLLTLAVAACTRAEGHRKESSKRSGTESNVPTGPLHLVVNGNVIAPRSVLATTRGGETVYLVLSSAADRTCDQLFAKDGVALASDEVLVWLDVLRPAIDGSSATSSSSPAWQIGRASWPGGISGAFDRDDGSRTSSVEIPDDIATRGGQLAVHYAGSFSVQTASPNASLALDGVIAVKPCGDRPSATGPTQLDAQIGKRRFPIRGATVTTDATGWALHLTSLPIPCPHNHFSDRSGDLGIEVATRGNDDHSVHLFGDAVPVQQQWSGPGSYGPAVKLELDGPLDGSGLLGIAVDVTTPLLAIHGRVTARRCGKE